MVRPSRGVTLIELIVVMAIVAVLLSFVGRSVSAGIDNLVLTSESRRVISAFRSAQASARSTGERVFAVYDETNLRFMRGDRVYQTLTMPAGIRFADAQRAT